MWQADEFAAGHSKEEEILQQGMPSCGQTAGETAANQGLPRLRGRI